MRYDPAKIEPVWQQRWDEEAVFRTPSDPETLAARPKYYILDMFPYPSGSGLHVGHPEGYTATDVLARLKRMQGYNVLHPMGWDAFGLPAERAAMRENIHPAVITKRNTDNFRGQIKRLGFSYDWEREVNTSTADYYKWTQWIFLKLYDRGLAYISKQPVNWCPALGTVLANEEVKDGAYVETGDPVERRMMEQWMLKITAYAERLLDDLDDLDWPDGVKDMQRNWIGKSTGAEVTFEVADSGSRFEVFTTRPDTLFGATFCVLAPEHSLVEEIVTDDRRESVMSYVAAAAAMSEIARTSDERDKSGVFTGAFAVNPVNGAKIPIWIADYVLAGYGTGAIMAVPGQDQRDWDFAEKFDLPIIRTVQPPADFDGQAYVGQGPAISSDFLNGLDIDAAKARVIEWLEEEGSGRGRTQYKLRDWLFSRQRYWGEPFPIVRLEDGSVAAIPVEQLPVELPAVDEYRPTEDGRPPLARASDEWLAVTLPDGRVGVRETNTMPQWAGSCWYYLRYIDPQNDAAPWDKAKENYWMPVDLYVGGVEHAVLHLLYSRFWHKVLYDCGLVSTKEPFQRLFNQGMILAYSYKDDKGKYFSPSEVEDRDGKFFARESGAALETQIEKMSKSKYNVVSPDDVIEQYGADAMRLYELFMGPLDQVKPWQMSGVEGVYRFLQRVWRLVVDEQSDALSARLVDAAAGSEPELERAAHKTIKKVIEDTEGMRFNTAIAQMMTFVNEATSAKTLPRETVRDFLLVLSPYAPHICEELWSRLGEIDLIARAEWPRHDESLCVEDTITWIVQVNGKKRDSVDAPRETAKGEIEKLAMATEGALRTLEGRAPKKVIVVPGRLVNIVV